MIEPPHFGILQNNLHKSKERTHAILNDPDMKNYAILMLQEQYWSPYTKSSPSHHSWTSTEPTTYENQPRSIIYTNNSLIPPSHIIPIPIPINDITAISIIDPSNPTDKPSLIINVYNAHSNNKDICDLQNFIEANFNKDNYGLIIMGGDFNLHHPLWNP
jgi:hypothetical protein